VSLLFGSILGAGFASTLSDEARHRAPWIQRKQRVTSRVHPPPQSD
jgi:hypothetical protein